MGGRVPGLSPVLELLPVCLTQSATFRQERSMRRTKFFETRSREEEHQQPAPASRSPHLRCSSPLTLALRYSPVPSLAHKNFEHRRGLPFCRIVDDPQNDALSRLPVEDRGADWCRKDERNDCKILLAVDEDDAGRVPEKVIDRPGEFVGDRAGGVLRRQPSRLGRGERVQGERIV